MSAFRYFILTVVNKDSVMSVVSEVKQRSERSQIFNFNKSEVKQCLSVVRDFILIVEKVKDRSGHSQRFKFNSS